MIKGIKTLICVISCSLLIWACNSNVVYDKSKEIENNIWRSDNVLKYSVNITDTASYYNYYVNLRNTADYKFSNLFVFLSTIFPDGQLSRDTLELFLAEPDGRWLGNRTGKWVDNRILLQKSFRFVMPGNYSFEFEQAMRTEALEGIADFGIRIEKTQAEKK